MTRMCTELRSFVLPEFGSAILQGDNDFVALPCAEYITRDPENELTIGE